MELGREELPLSEPKGTKNKNIPFSTESSVTQEHISFMVQNLFEYDWSPDTRGQLLQQISESLVWYLIEKNFFSLKPGEVLPHLQSAFNQLSKMVFPKSALDLQQFQRHCHEIIHQISIEKPKEKPKEQSKEKSKEKLKEKQILIEKNSLNQSTEELAKSSEITDLSNKYQNNQEPNFLQEPQELENIQEEIQEKIEVIQENNEETYLVDFKKKRKAVKIETLIETLKAEQTAHSLYMRECFEKIRSLVENHEKMLEDNQILKEIIDNREQTLSLIQLEEAYLVYLEKHHLQQEPKQHNAQKQPKKQVLDDILCHVCNDGDYQDHNLIVLCAQCNLSVHQRCYAIEHVPQDDWICDVCTQFQKQGQSMICPLCPCTGGAMKQSTLKITELLSDPHFSQTHPHYHSLYSQARPYLKNTELNEEGFFYDFNKTQKLLIDQPPPLHEYLWVHISCAKISQEFHLEKVRRTFQVKYQKSDLPSQKPCYICTKEGGQVRCAFKACERQFHVECARREGCFFDQDQKKDPIFCKQHTPLKLRRTLQSNQNSNNMDIAKFLTNFGSHLAFQKKSQQEEENINLTDVTDEQLKQYGHFMAKLREEVNKLPINSFYVDYSVLKTEKFKYRISEINVPRKHNQQLALLKETDAVWRNFKYKKLNKKQCFRKYTEILKFDKMRKTEQEENQKKYKLQQDYIRHNKQKCSNIQDLFIHQGNLVKIDFQEDQDFNIYCVCRALYTTGEDMMQCEVCDNWYHYKCIGFLGNDQQAGEYDFICQKCEEKQPLQTTQENHFKMLGHFQTYLFTYHKKLYPDFDFAQYKQQNQKENDENLQKNEQNNINQQNEQKKINEDNLQENVYELNSVHKKIKFNDYTTQQDILDSQQEIEERSEEEIIDLSNMLQEHEKLYQIQEQQREKG